MARGILEHSVFGTVCFVVFITTMVGQTIAATKKVHESALVVIADTKPAMQPSEQGQNPLIQRAKKTSIPATKERQPEAIQTQAKPESTERKPMSLKESRRIKGHKKGMPKAVVQPKLDLMYHGLLESPQRYDLRRHHLGVGVPDPRTSELTHDHFLELDRNQDGKIDPVERVFGRPDMDRDFSTHQRQ